MLSAIVPIMNEVEYATDQQIFAKGDLGASLFIVHEGAVGIYNGEHRLITFRAGDFWRAGAARCRAPLGHGARPGAGAGFPPRPG
ncbi:hypothetical protein ACFQT0_03145 [Hymenobacter humi]|uniref:Cyclic nucleotide-binding domain-containing protein n=1 Tax=Hymenobacter humi TaxID=1411620 RepID=A0ABW2U287_9BACT